MKISNTLRNLRKENNLTLKELSAKSGISISFISDIENGRRNPSIDTLTTLAKALNTSVNVFFDKKQNTNNIIKENQVVYNANEFKTPQDAIKFILEQPAIMGFGGFDINKMSDNEIMDFANELLNQLKLLGYKYKR